MELLKQRIQAVIETLKADSPYGSQSVEFLDPDKEIPFDGPTDIYAFYAYVKEDNQDAEMRNIGSASSGLQVAKSRYRLIANISDVTEKQAMLKWLMWKLKQITGVQTINYSEQSERIYKEETGKDLQTWMPIIRIRFSVSTIVTAACLCEPDPCENAPCI